MFTDPQKNLLQFSIGAGMKLADFGAGTGFYSVEAGKLVGASGKIFAVEVQKELLDKIKANATAARLTNVEVIWGDIERIGGTNIRDMACDRVIISNVLFQAENKADIILEAKRILKMGGKVMLIDWAIGAPVGPVNFVNKETARFLLEKAGLTFEKDIEAGDHHYGLIYKK